MVFGHLECVREQNLGPEVGGEREKEKKNNTFISNSHTTSTIQEKNLLCASLGLGPNGADDIPGCFLRDLLDQEL